MACTRPLKRRRRQSQETEEVDHADEATEQGYSTGEGTDVDFEIDINNVETDIDSEDLDFAVNDKDVDDKEAHGARREREYSPLASSPCRINRRQREQQHRYGFAVAARPPKLQHRHHKRDEHDSSQVAAQQLDLDLNVDLDVVPNNVFQIVTSVVSRIVVLPTKVLTELRTVTLTPALGVDIPPIATTTVPADSTSTDSFADPPIRPTETPQDPSSVQAAPLPPPDPTSTTTPDEIGTDGPGPQTPAPTPQPAPTRGADEDTPVLTTLTSTINGFPANETISFTGSASTTTRNNVVIIYTSVTRSTTTLRTRTSSSSLSTRRIKSTTTEELPLESSPPFGVPPGGGDGILGPPPPAPEVPSDSSGHSGPGLPPHKAKLVGGIVGGIAGIALLLFALLFIIRRHKRSLKPLSHRRLPDNSGSTSKPPMAFLAATGRSMLPRRTPPPPPLTPPSAILAGAAPGTATSTPDSTVGAAAGTGFVKLHGRKMEKGSSPGTSSRIEYEHSWIDNPTPTGSPSRSPPLPIGQAHGGYSPASSLPRSSAGTFSPPARGRNPFEDPPGTSGTGSYSRRGSFGGSGAYHHHQGSSSASGSGRGIGGPGASGGGGGGGGRGHAHGLSMSSSMGGWSEFGDDPPPPPPGTAHGGGGTGQRRPVFPRQRSLIEGGDGVGRSLAGQDGSRGSRFTEDI